MDPAKSLIRRGLLLIACLPLCIGAGWLYWQYEPQSYLAKAVIEVPPDAFENGGSPSPPPPPFRVIQSKEILYPVIDEMRLAAKWSVTGQEHTQEPLYARLRKMLSASMASNTNRMEIGVNSTDPVEAAALANAIAAEFVKNRTEHYETLAKQSLSELKEELEKQRQKADIARAQLAKIGDPAATDYSEVKDEYGRQVKLLDAATARYTAQQKSMSILAGEGTSILERAEVPVTPVYRVALSVLIDCTCASILLAFCGVVLLRKGLRMQAVAG